MNCAHQSDTSALKFVDINFLDWELVQTANPVWMLLLGLKVNKLPKSVTR